MKNSSSLLELIKECKKVDDSVCGKPSNDRLDYSVGVFLRQELSAITLYCICEPVHRPEIFRSNEKFPHDFQSGFVISRSMYETVLLSNLILLSDQLNSCRNAFLKIARLQSLRERIRFAKNMNSQRPEAVRQENMAKELKQEIIAHPEFEVLPQITREFVEEKGKVLWKWHEYSMQDLACIAGFDKTWHTQYYGFLSNYAHADPLSIEQVESIRSPKQAEDLASIIPSYAENFLSRSLIIHVETCRSEGIEVNIPPHLIELTDYWKDLNGKVMANAFHI